MAALLLVGWGCQKPTESTGAEGEESAVRESTAEESFADIWSKGKGLDNFSYDQITITPEGLNEAKVWRLGKKMRYETGIAGQKTEMYMNLESGQTYMYNSATGTAIAMT